MVPRCKLEVFRQVGADRGADADEILSVDCTPTNLRITKSAWPASVKTTERAYAAFVKNERFKQTIDLLDTPVVPKLKIVR